MVSLLMGDFWVFGYGSLIWNPGFEFIAKEKAMVRGLHRSLCLQSWVHRGTKENPGLILGLDEGGSCEGIAMKVAAKDRDPVIDYLRARELVTDVYLEIWHQTELEDGTTVEALTYKVDTSHEQYSGSLSLEIQRQMVSQAQGQSGHNIDYIKNTAKALQDAGITDPHLDELANSLG